MLPTRRLTIKIRVWTVEIIVLERGLVGGVDGEKVSPQPSQLCDCCRSTCVLAYTMLILRRGLLVIYKTNDGVERAFHNLPGVKICCVDRLNLLQIVPGGLSGCGCAASSPTTTRTKRR